MVPYTRQVVTTSVCLVTNTGPPGKLVFPGRRWRQSGGSITLWSYMETCRRNLILLFKENVQIYHSAEKELASKMPTAPNIKKCLSCAAEWVPSLLRCSSRQDWMGTKFNILMAPGCPRAGWDQNKDISIRPTPRVIRSVAWNRLRKNFHSECRLL